MTLADNANRAFQRNVTIRWTVLQVMQVVPSGAQICNYHLVAKFGPNASGAKFATKASGTIWWPKLQLMQMSPSGGQFWN